MRDTTVLVACDEELAFAIEPGHDPRNLPRDQHDVDVRGRNAGVAEPLDDILLNGEASHDGESARLVPTKVTVAPTGTRISLGLNDQICDTSRTS